MARFLNNLNYAIINPIIGLLFAVAFVVFFIGIVKFISSADSDDGRQQGKRTIIFGLLGMLIMFSAFGIMRFIISTLNSTIGPVNPPSNLPL